MQRLVDDGENEESGEIVNREISSCHKEGDLPSRPILFKRHLDILCRSKRYHVAILISIFDAQRSVIAARSAEADFSANLFDEIIILCSSRDLYNEYILVEVNFDLDGMGERSISSPIHGIFKVLRPGLADPDATKGRLA
jgi:hypothetical protein